MLALQDSDGNRPAFNPDRGQTPDGRIVACSAFQPLKLQVKAAGGIRMGAGSFGAAVSRQKLSLGVMIQKFRIVAGRFDVVELLGQSQSEVFLLVARLKLAVSGRGGTPGYLIENVCHGILLMIKMPVQNSVCLLRRGQPLLLRPDLISQPVVKGRKQELHRDPQNDPKAQGIGQ